VASKVHITRIRILINLTDYNCKFIGMINSASYCLFLDRIQRRYFILNQCKVLKPYQCFSRVVLESRLFDTLKALISGAVKLVKLKNVFIWN
jgi:hypothetical protein